MKIIVEHSTAAQLGQPAGRMLAGRFTLCDLANAPESEGPTNVLTPNGDCFFDRALMRAQPH